MCCCVTWTGGWKQVDLRLVISFLYEDTGIFEWKRRKMKNRKEVASDTRSHALSSVTPGEESSRNSSNTPGPRGASRASAGGARGGDLRAEDGDSGDSGDTKISEDKDGTLDGFEGRIGEDWTRRLEREDEAILGFSNDGGDAAGKVCRGLDRLMALMAAARSLNLTRLQVEIDLLTVVLCHPCFALCCTAILFSLLPYLFCPNVQLGREVSAFLRPVINADIGSSNASCLPRLAKFTWEFTF